MLYFILVLVLTNVITVLYFYFKSREKNNEGFDLNAILKSSDNAIMVVNDGNILYVNDVLAEMLGFLKGEILNLRFNDVTSSEDEEDFWTVVAGVGDPQYYEITLVTSDLLPVNTVAKASYYKDKNGMNIVLNIKPIENNYSKGLKNNIDFYMTIINTIDSMVFVTDLEGHLKIANDVALNFLGKSMDLILGKNIKELIPILSYELSKISDVFTYSKTQIFNTVEVKINEEKRYFNVKIFSLQNENKEILIKIDDVTNYINIEAFITKSEKFVSSISQIAFFNLKLKNELSAAVTNLYLLDKKEELSAKKNLISKVKTSLVNMSELSENFSFVSQGMNVYHKSNVSIEKIVDTAKNVILNDYDFLRDYKFDESMVEFDSSSNNFVDVFLADHLQQVVSNLIMFNVKRLGNKATSPKDILKIKCYDNEGYLFIVFENKKLKLNNEFTDILNKHIYENEINEKLPIGISKFIVNHYFKGEFSFVSNEEKGSKFIVKLNKENLVKSSEQLVHEEK